MQSVKFAILRVDLYKTAEKKGESTISRGLELIVLEKGVWFGRETADPTLKKRGSEKT